VNDESDGMRGDEVAYFKASSICLLVVRKAINILSENSLSPTGFRTRELPYASHNLIAA
jgi:hypothetical protein